MVTAILRIGANIVTVYQDRLETHLPDGSVVHAWPVDDAPSRTRAWELGYPGVREMTLEHDLIHTRLAVALGLPESPALRDGLNGRRPTTLGLAEEAMVLAAQRFLNLWRLSNHKDAPP